MPLYRRLPKRGFTNIFALRFAEINLGRLQEALTAGKIDGKNPITGEELVKAGLLRRVWDGVRLLGKGELKDKVSIEVAGATKAAIAAVEKAGGSVKVLTVKAEAKEEKKKKS